MKLRAAVLAFLAVAVQAASEEKEPEKKFLRKQPQPPEASSSSFQAADGSNRRRSGRDLSPDFAVDVTNAVCPGLTMVAVSEAPSEAACEDRCRSDPNCDLYQYCEWPRSCRTFEGQWSMKNYHRCFVATSSSPPDQQCIPDHNFQWLGKARTGSDKVPTRTAEISRKRGFSGYLNLGGTATAECRDAQALG